MAAWDSPAEVDGAAERALERWLAELFGAGEVADVRGVLVDLRALTARRFACLPVLCTPGQRARGVLSCCADIQVPLSAAERRAIDSQLPLVTATMRPRDPRWTEGAPVLYEDPKARSPTLARPGRRCVFAFASPGGLRCGLHAAALEAGLPLARLKPSSCRLFPLVLLRHGRRTLVTASYGEVSAALGGPPERRLACIGSDANRKVADAPPLYVACKEALVEVFGPDFYRALDARAKARDR